MVALKMLLMAAGAAMFGSTASVVAYDVYLATQFQQLMGSRKLGAAKKARTRPRIRPALVLNMAQGVKYK
jgi:hypothetical protein